MAAYSFHLPRLFVDDPLAEKREPVLGKEQANYIRNVMRLGAGDQLLVFNGRDGEWLAEVAEADRKRVTLVLRSQTRAQTPPGDIWYCFAPLKAARLDYMVQKAVEMGASRIVPVMTQRTVPGRVNIDRMRANVIEAAEQCGVLSIPPVAGDERLEAFLGRPDADRLLIFCDEDAPVRDPLTALAALVAAPGQTLPLAVLIGPEGGFSDQERAILAERPNTLRLSLGPRILRADTAAVTAMSLVQAVLGDLRG